MPDLRLLPPALLVMLVGLGGLAGAQTAAPEKTAAPVLAPQVEGRTDRRIERIQIEDAGLRIDELRVGGETQSIVVSPKGGMPAYEVLPPNNRSGPATGQRNSSASSGGTRVWKILDF